MPDKISKATAARFLNTNEKQFKKGMETYGKPLTAFNGRDSFQDFWEELVDLANYASQIEVEYTNLALYLYIFSIVYGFHDLIPQPILDRIHQIVGDDTVEELKERMGLRTHETPSGSKDIPFGS